METRVLDHSDVIVKRIFINSCFYIFLSYVYIFSYQSRSFLHRFHNICTRCPVERWSTLSLSLSVYFNPFNYELHQSRVSLFSLHGRHSFQPLSCHEIFNILGIQLSKAAVFIHRRGFHPLPPGNNGSRSITGRTSSFRRRRRRRRMKRDEFFQPTLTNLTLKLTFLPRAYFRQFFFDTKPLL